jgi:hypothetical protein
MLIESTSILVENKFVFKKVGCFTNKWITIANGINDKYNIRVYFPVMLKILTMTNATKNVITRSNKAIPLLEMPLEKEKRYLRNCEIMSIDFTLSVTLKFKNKKI